MKILVCPLNWGLGHATRSGKLIESLMRMGHEVHIGSDGLAAMTLQKAFPLVPIHVLAPLNIQYGKWFWFTLLRQTFHLISWHHQDRVKIKELHKKHRFDLIISDSRLGARSQDVKSIVLIHQCSPIVPYGFILHRWLWHQLKRFDKIWIPDLPNQILSGSLSHLPDSIHRLYIGYLSRISQYFNPSKAKSSSNKILAIVSGPEPSRTEFENKLKKVLKFNDVMIAGGRPDLTHQDQDHHQYSSYLDAESMALEIEKAEYVICRAGYSTLMELASFRKKLIMVPTPGQAEQHYLAKRIEIMNMGVIWNMEKQEWSQIKSQVDKKNEFSIENQPELLERAIMSLH